MICIDPRGEIPQYQRLGPEMPLPLRSMVVREGHGRFMGHDMIALTAPTIHMKMHRHAKYAQHSALLPSQTIRLSQSCTAWHAAPAPRQRHNACSAARHSNPRTYLYTHTDLIHTQSAARACTASQTRSPGTPSHRHVHSVRTGQTCALKLH